MPSGRTSYRSKPQLHPLLAAAFAVMVGSFFFKTAQARELNQRELLARCYAHLTGLRLGSKDPLYSELKNKPAKQVCFELLDAVKFGGDGALANANDPVHRAILKQLHDFHRSWFEKRMLGPTELNDALFGTIDVYDPGQPSFYITRSFFTQGLHYNSVLRGHDNLEAIRDPSKVSTLGSASGLKRPSRIYHGGYDGAGHTGVSRINEPVVAFAPTYDINALEFAPVPLAQVGELIGVRVQPGTANLGALWTKASGGGGTINDSGLITPLNLHENFGGGALGSQAFLILNFGHGLDYDTNGTTKLPRRWIGAAFKSFLCREGPYARMSDIAAFKRSSGDAPSFRQSEACLRCHATLDQAALTSRNLVLGQTSTFIATYNRLTATMGRFNVTAGSEPNQEFWPWRPVSSFKHQAPQGKLFFRSITGNLIDRNVANLNDLGTAVSDTDDYYACAASRYVERFMGISMSLFDPNDHDSSVLLESMSERDKEFRRWILALGQELRMTGSLKNLVKRIIQSDYYKQSDFGI